ncbi:hypothetical protein RvY_06209-2 [Ramazzottius varieornatus]|uniref:Methyltransferase domain-containing protein n=1 Tax=Ramazzottius varieornatus TaxID=947166 RepID=A0A1D1UXR5_RAMVA|nr:hypothetical protein RvY_06209-2 [Ramazzottius varieornatus]
MSNGLFQPARRFRKNMLAASLLSVRPSSSVLDAIVVIVMTTSLNSMSASRDRQYYLHDFNARLYLDQFYGSTKNGHTTITNEASGFIFSTLKSFLQRCPKGEGRLLDMGTGPCLANVIPAARYFNHIYCADLSPKARQELEKWRLGRADAFDWTTFFKLCWTKRPTNG